ncbi:response regulator [Candidatus Riflebacteria bacterium]
MKILIVEDSKTMRNLIKREFENSEYEVFEASDGEEAQKAFKNIKPDLITMDVNMPKMNGFDACARIRGFYDDGGESSGQDIPIIFITSHDTYEERKKGFEVGATDFLTKPFPRGELNKLVRHLTSRKDKESFYGTKAVVAEDNRTTRRLLGKILETEGIKCFYTENGAEALKVMETRGNEIDLLLTDYFMPEMDGIELCKKVREDLKNKNVPIIFLSGINEQSHIVDMFKAGATDYVTKPFTKEELLARFKVHLHARQLNRDLEWRVKELKRLNDWKDDFLAITSHDLKSPLTGILGYAQLLDRANNLTKTQKRMIANITRAGDFLVTLINDILILSRIQSEDTLEFENLALVEYINSSIETVSHMATPKEVKLKLKNNTGSEIYLCANKNALLRIFNNLLSNAIKFTNKKGQVQTILDFEAEDYVSISVKDNGIGIPEQSIPLLFKEFSKVSRTGTAGELSTGLGLSITKKLIEKHQGQITVTSKENKGTCFKILLPLNLE